MTRVSWLVNFTYHLCNGLPWPVTPTVRAGRYNLDFERGGMMGNVY